MAQLTRVCVERYHTGRDELKITALLQHTKDRGGSEIGRLYNMLDFTQHLDLGREHPSHVYVRTSESMAFCPTMSRRD